MKLSAAFKLALLTVAVGGLPWAGNAPNTALFDYYAGLVAYARSLKPQYQVIGNPGTNTEEAYRIRDTADVLTIFEGDGASYSGYAPASWTQKYPTFQFAHLLYAVS